MICSCFKIIFKVKEIEKPKAKQLINIKQHNPKSLIFTKFKKAFFQSLCYIFSEKKALNSARSHKVEPSLKLIPPKPSH